MSRLGAVDTRILIAAAIVVVLVVAGATLFMIGGRPGAEVGVEEKGVIVIGAPLSLTGRYAKEGEMSLMGALAVVRWINDNGGVVIGGKRYTVELSFYDDESNPDRVISIIDTLVREEGAKFLLAPYSSGLTAKAAPIAERYGVIMVSHGGASDKIFQQGYRYVVQILTPASRYFESVLDMVADLDPEARRVAIIYKESEFAKTVAEGAKRYAEELGFDVVFFKSYPADASDLTPILQELKQANPDIIIGGGHFQDGQLLTRQLAELDINAKLVGILVAPALPDYYEALGALAEGIVYPSQWEPGVKYSPDNVPPGFEWYGPTVEEFISYFKMVARERGKPEDLMPSYHAAEAGASILFIVRAIEKAQSLDPDDVREAMNQLRLYTYYGALQIDPETGLQIAHDMVVGQWQNGEKVVVWPREAAEASPVYPLKPWREKAASS